MGQTTFVRSNTTHVSACTETIVSRVKTGTCTGKYNRNLRARLNIHCCYNFKMSHTVYNVNVYDPCHF